MHAFHGLFTSFVCRMLISETSVKHHLFIWCHTEVPVTCPASSNHSHSCPHVANKRTQSNPSTKSHFNFSHIRFAVYFRWRSSLLAAASASLDFQYRNIFQKKSWQCLNQQNICCTRVQHSIYRVLAVEISKTKMEYNSENIYINRIFSIFFSIWVKWKCGKSLCSSFPKVKIEKRKLTGWFFEKDVSKKVKDL